MSALQYENRKTRFKAGLSVGRGMGNYIQQTVQRMD